MRLMTGKRAGTLLELMDQTEYFTLARAWENLTDDEFFWEPFTGWPAVSGRGQSRAARRWRCGRASLRSV